MVTAAMLLAFTQVLSEFDQQLERLRRENAEFPIRLDALELAKLSPTVIATDANVGARKSACVDRAADARADDGAARRQRVASSRLCFADCATWRELQLLSLERGR